MVWSESAISRAETWYLASVSSISSTSVTSDLGRGRRETEWVGVPRAETLGEETGPPAEVEDDGCSLSIPTLPHSHSPQGDDGCYPMPGSASSPPDGESSSLMQALHSRRTIRTDSRP